MDIGIIKRASVTALSVYAASLCLLALMCAVALQLPDPDVLVGPSAYITLTASALACGIVSAARHPVGGIVCGVIYAVLYQLTSAVVSVSSDASADIMVCVLSFVGIIALSALGSLFCRLLSKTAASSSHSVKGYLAKAEKAAGRVGHYNKKSFNERYKK